MPKLVLLDGDDAGKQFPLIAGQEYVLGRATECAITLADVPGVSRRHAVFRCRDGAWEVEDLGSHNGIYFQREQIRHRRLEPGDVLWFSNASIQFVDGAAAPAPVAAAPAASATAAAVPAADGPPPGATIAIRLPESSAPASAPEPVPATGPVAAAPESPRPAPAPAEVPAAIDPARIAELRRLAAQIDVEFGKVVVGQRQVLQQLLIALLSSGHCLMVGLPGLAKTLMVRTLADILDLHFKRIQFTPDLMPSDIIGSDVLEVDEDTGKKSLRFIHGPIFTNMLLADEINRTPPKTQSALLEAMQERQVTVANHRFPLPAPFFVLATQNPLEQEGTYPLPEAQLDRFMLNVFVDYPSEAEEEQIVQETTRKQVVSVQKILAGADLLRLQDLTRELPVSPHVVKYATRLARATRPADPLAPGDIRKYVHCGAGPRAAQYLVLGAKARAVLDGRINVNCDDVRSLAIPVMRHRIFTNFAADSENLTTEALIQRLLLHVPEPGPKDYA